MDATLKAALEGAGFVTFTAVSFALSGGTIYLSSGVDVTISGQLYSAYNSTYGSLKDVDVIADGSDGQASRGTVVVSAPSMSAMSTWVANCSQGTAVYIYQGAINPSTGASIGTVETLLRGEIDVPRIAPGLGVFDLTWEVGTEELRLLERNEERKLSDAFHQSCFSGETGLSRTSALTRQIPWRAKDPAASASPSTVINTLFNR